MTGLLLASVGVLSVTTSLALAAPHIQVRRMVAGRWAMTYLVVLVAGLVSSVLATSSSRTPVLWPGVLAVVTLVFLHMAAQRGQEHPAPVRQLVPLVGPSAVLLSIWIIGGEVTLTEAGGLEGIAWSALAGLGGISIGTHFGAAYQAKVDHRGESSFIDLVLLRAWIGGISELIGVLVAFPLIVTAIRTPSLDGVSTWDVPWGATDVAGGAMVGALLAAVVWLVVRTWLTRAPLASSPLLRVIVCLLPPLGATAGLGVLVATDGYAPVGPVILMVAALLAVFTGRCVSTNVLRLSMVTPGAPSLVVAAGAGLGIGVACLWLLAFGVRAPGEVAPAAVPTSMSAVAVFLALATGLASFCAANVRRLHGLHHHLTESPGWMNVLQDTVMYSALAVAVGAVPTFLSGAARGGNYVAAIVAVGGIVGAGLTFAVKANNDHVANEAEKAKPSMEEEARSRGVDEAQFFASWTRRLERHGYWNYTVAAVFVVLGAVEALRLWR